VQVTYDSIYKLIERIGLRDHADGSVSHGTAGCVCGATLPARTGHRAVIVERVSQWISQHLGDGHRIFPGNAEPHPGGLTRLH